MLADALPTEGEVLGVLAARLFGDAHALDAKTTLGALAVGLAAAIGRVPPASGAHARRAAWLACGVVVDDLSSTVIALGLPGGTTSPTARALAALSESGQPAVLTYRQLAVDDIGRCPEVVWVCENPAVVASAADRVGATAAALVCVNGQPGAAVVRLLTRLGRGRFESSVPRRFRRRRALDRPNTGEKRAVVAMAFRRASLPCGVRGWSSVADVHGNGGGDSLGSGSCGSHGRAPVSRGRGVGASRAPAGSGDCVVFAEMARV